MVAISWDELNIKRNYVMHNYKILKFNVFKGCIPIFLSISVNTTIKHFRS